MNGSEPPSSSTTFFSARPAASATFMPAPSLPVRVTATMRWSAMSAATLSDLMGKFWNRPAGAPAAITISSIAAATPCTLEACFNKPTLPAMIVGARKRTTCQYGKFHGITASTGPIGCQVAVAPWNWRGSSIAGPSCA